MIMKKYKGIFITIFALALASCNSYLDTLPDDRTEVNDPTKVPQLLVSAYPVNSADMMMEHASDNIIDNGSMYTSQDYQEYMYKWQPIVTTSWESTQWVWESHYAAIAVANYALKYIDELGSPENLNSCRAEALLCRAFAMFRLSNVFCMAYDPTKAKEYKGLPYPTDPETPVEERGTLEDLYQKISADIDAALPYVDDSRYGSSAKYHFNTKAAYAFAARFNLYYHKYDKAIQYATAAIGSNPSGVLRNYAQYLNLAGVDDINNAYVAATEPANFLMVTANSINGRAQYSSSWRRYACHLDLWQQELVWAPMPWGSGSTNNTLYQAKMLYGGANQSVYLPFMVEFFAVTDKIANTGTPYIVDVMFKADETLLVRAEAYVLQKKYAEALADMNYWVGNHCAERTGTARRPVLTEDVINNTFNNMAYTPDTVVATKQRTPKKHLHPQGFTVDEGTQENMIQMVLHMRRLETWQQGLRFQDLKRYGIVFSHSVYGSDPIIFEAGDPRGAFQIPQDAIKVGIEPNDYGDKTTTPVSPEDQQGRSVKIECPEK